MKFIYRKRNDREGWQSCQKVGKIYEADSPSQSMEGSSYVMLSVSENQRVII